MKNFKRAIAKCAGIVSVFCFGSMTIAQSKITSDLFVLSGMAFNKNPSIQRSFLSIKDAEANFLIQKACLTSISDQMYPTKSRYNLLENDPRNQYLNRILTDNVDLTSTLSKSSGLARLQNSGCSIHTTETITLLTISASMWDLISGTIPVT